MLPQQPCPAPGCPASSALAWCSLSALLVRPWVISNLGIDVIEDGGLRSGLVSNRLSG